MINLGTSRTLVLGVFTIRINWLIAGCVVFTVLGFIRLGAWQLGRADEKLQAQAEFEARQTANAEPIDQLFDRIGQQDRESLRNLHVALQGEYVNGRTILVLAQFFEGQIGYEVVTPLRLGASRRLVLVSRGWTSGILPPNTPPSLRPIDGPVEVTAQLHVPDADQRTIASRIDASQWPLRVRQIEIDVLEELLGEPLFPYLLRLTQDQPGMLVRHWPETYADIGTNLSYALQWFGFAFIVFVVSLLRSSNLIALMRDPEVKSGSRNPP